MNRYTRQAYALRRLSAAVDRQILGDVAAGRWVMRWAAIAGLTDGLRRELRGWGAV